MELIYQEPGTSQCGQCVVAMACGVDFDLVIRAMGTGRNYPNDLRKGLKHFGYDFANKRSEPLVNYKGPVGEVSAVFIHNLQVDGRSIQHWVLWDVLKFLDPLNGIVDELSKDCQAGSYRIVKHEKLAAGGDDNPQNDH